MKFSLSTNWCNRRIEDGGEIADLAAEMGFDELELGFHTSIAQAAGFRKTLDRMPIGSVHAFCPVPVSAPQGYPELYLLADPDENARAIARVHVRKNVVFAAELGADTVVLHAGRAGFTSFFRRNLSSPVLDETLREAEGDLKSPVYAKLLSKCAERRKKSGEKMLEPFIREIETLLPELERNKVALAFENLPYLEGFPDERETRIVLDRFRSPWVKAWFDTGHDKVREVHGWKSPGQPLAPGDFAGMHLNDIVRYSDDHFAPGDGKIDFAVFGEIAKSAGHVVFEPRDTVPRANLERGLAHIRGLYAPTVPGRP